MKKVNNRNRLFEIMDRVAGTTIMESPEGLEVGGKKYYFRDLKITTYSFIYFVQTDTMIISKRNDTHGDALIDYYNLDTNNPTHYKFLTDNAYNNPKNVIKGRIWVDFKVLSFWGDYIPKHDVDLVKQELKKNFPDINEYRVDEYNTVT